MKKLAPYRKAIAGAIVGALGAAATALSDGSISAPEWCLIASAAVVGAVGVYAAPRNTSSSGE